MLNDLGVDPLGELDRLMGLRLSMGDGGDTAYRGTGDCLVVGAGGSRGELALGEGDRLHLEEGTGLDRPNILDNHWYENHKHSTLQDR